MLIRWINQVWIKWTSVVDFRTSREKIVMKINKWEKTAKNEKIDSLILTLKQSDRNLVQRDNIGMFVNHTEIEKVYIIPTVILQYWSWNAWNVSGLVFCLLK